MSGSESSVSSVSSVSTAVSVQVVRLDADLPLPAAAHRGDAGVDLYASTDVLLRRAGGRVTVPTGLAVALAEGYGGFVLPRSGLAAKQGVTVLNAPGLIDAGYRGEIMVPLVNTDPDRDVHIQRGDRIAQLLVLPVPAINWIVVESVSELPPSRGNDDDGSNARGTGGHGSSGR